MSNDWREGPLPLGRDLWRRGFEVRALRTFRISHLIGPSFLKDTEILLSGRDADQRGKSILQGDLKPSGIEP